LALCQKNLMTAAKGFNTEGLYIGKQWPPAVASISVASHYRPSRMQQRAPGYSNRTEGTCSLRQGLVGLVQTGDR
jgi:hypothetical protein